MSDRLTPYLAAETETLAQVAKLPASLLQLPGPDWLDRVCVPGDRSAQVLRSLGQLFGAGGLGGSGYLLLLRGSQGLESVAGTVWAAQPQYCDPVAIAELAIAGGCSGLVGSAGFLAPLARRYGHRIPLVMRLNGVDVLSYPSRNAAIVLADPDQAWAMGAVAVAATLDLAVADTAAQLTAIGLVFAKAHGLGLATLLWCDFKNAILTQDRDYGAAADLTGQAQYLATAIGADLVQLRLPGCDRGFAALAQATGKPYGTSSSALYELTGDSVLDRARYQVLNGNAGRVGLLHGVEGTTAQQWLNSAIVNKRSGGCGLLLGKELLGLDPAVAIDRLELLQEIYRSAAVTIA
jgi:fructose-bisphosphate aldolase, class I